MAAVVYREHPPGPALAGVVECIWTIRSDAPIATPRLNRVLPDGCMDVIFDLGERPDSTPAGIVVGTMRRPMESWVQGRVDMLGVRFLPGGAAPLLRLAAGELTDTVVGLDEVVRRFAGAHAGN